MRPLREAAVTHRHLKKHNVQHVHAHGVTMTPSMYVLLVAANGCSLPGDGLRIVGRWLRSARALEGMGFVRVSSSMDNAHVHITKKGRAWREKVAQGALLAGRAEDAR